MKGYQRYYSSNRLYKLYIAWNLQTYENIEKSPDVHRVNIIDLIYIKYH